MKTKKAIEYLTLTKIESRNFEGKNYDEIINLLKRGEAFEKVWNKLKIMSYPCVCGHAEPLKKPLEKLEQEYFPKPKNSRWQRINDMVDGLNSIGKSTDIKELIHLLIELRDEELEGSD